MRIKAGAAFLITLILLFLTNEFKHVIFMLLCAAIHETGHLITLRLCGVKVKGIVAGLFGGTIVLEKKLVSYPREAAIAVSGALANLIFAGIFFCVLRHGFTEDIFFLFLSNLAYALFNLLPVSTLDGGTALLALLATKKELYDAEKTAFAVSRITLFWLAVFSLFLVSVSAFNISLFVLTLLLYAESTEGHIISGYEFCRRTS